MSSLLIDIPVDVPSTLLEELLALPIGKSSDLGSCSLVRTGELTYELKWNPDKLSTTIDTITGGEDEFIFADQSATSG